MLKDFDTTKKYCLVGLGVLFEECFEQIKIFLNKTPDYLYDNSEEKWGKVFKKITCLNLEEFKSLDKKTNFIICVRPFEGIKSQLNDLGFKNIFLIKFERGINRIRKIDDILISKSSISKYCIETFEKWALITGSTRGIGLKIAQELAKLGFNLILHGTDKNQLIKIVRGFSDYNVKIKFINSNFLDKKSFEQFLIFLKDIDTNIDVAYLNAGISLSAPKGFWGMKYQDFETSFKINSIAPIKIAQTILPKMIINKFGRIIISSSSIQNRPGEMAYACSKAAIDKFVYDLSSHLPKNVSLCLLDPGWIKTDMGGIHATKDVDTLYPGVLIPAIINGNLNGKWISVQDYVNYDLKSAIKKAFYIEDLLEIEDE